MAAEIDSVMPGAYLEERFERFFRAYYSREILRLVRGYPEEKSLTVNFEDLDSFDIALAEEVLNNPDLAIPAAQRVLSRLELPVDMPSIQLYVRFINLPETSRLQIREIRSVYVGKLIAVEGIVRKVTDVRPRAIVAAFECQRCGSINRVTQEGDLLQKPVICHECERRGPFKFIPEQSVLQDSQRALIQEDLNDLKGGEQAKTLEVRISEDLCGRLMPGDRVRVAGILRVLQKKRNSGAPATFDIYLEANSIEVSETSYDEIEITEEDKKQILALSRDPMVLTKLRDSIAPDIIGYEKIKEAIMYQLFSAPAIVLADGQRKRGDSHIIIMGEPATGKSEILRYVANQLAPRGIFATGKGASGVGLTVSAVRDDFTGGWSLEAGALVIADLGIACIDEFAEISREDMAALHTAMEQQKIYIDKAGLHASFNSRCAILAAANPKYGRFDDYRPLSEQVNLPPPILSRFDLIFFVRDDLKDTRRVARHIGRAYIEPETIEPPVPPELFKKYIAYARQNIHPRFTEESWKVIEDFYVEMREAAARSEDVPIPLTARQLHGAARIAMQRARARLSNVVTVEDAQVAVELLKESLMQAGLDLDTGRVDIDKIYVGITKSQRDRIKLVRSIIAGLEREYGDATEEEIIGIAIQQGLDEDAVKDAISKLLEKGDIFEPRSGRFKTT